MEFKLLYGGKEKKAQAVMVVMRKQIRKLIRGERTRSQMHRKFHSSGCAVGNKTRSLDLNSGI